MSFSRTFLQLFRFLEQESCFLWTIRRLLMVYHKWWVVKFAHTKVKILRFSSLLLKKLHEISTIISQPRYLEITNDQSVIEICVNRCTSCIRETDTAEVHCHGLVQLLETCLQFNHKPQSKRSEDPPHAKISADIISCIFLNYNKKAVMELGEWKILEKYQLNNVDLLVALPVAVKFLNKENKELSRNLASYLSLAAIEYTDLLVPYIDIILNSLLCGNYSLARVVLQLYEISSESAIITRTRSIIDILPKCDTIDKNILLQLVATIIQSNSTTNNGISLLIIDKLPQFFDLILTSSTATQALMVLLRLAEKKPAIFHEYIGLLILTAQKLPNTICLIGQILSAIGKKSREKAQVALEFIMENLPNTDRTAQTTLLQEAVKLCSQYPILFNDKLTSVIRQRNLSQQSLLNQKPNSQSTTGNVTIVSLNSTMANAPSRPSQNVPTKSQVTMVVNQQSNQSNSQQQQHSIPTSTNSQHYSRRPKFDSRSTGRLHSGTGINNAHRSMTRLNASGVNNSNLGGLHKSMTRLSSSQQINQTQNPIGNGFNSNNNNDSSFIPPTVPPPLSQHVMITGENKWGIPSTKITSCGVTVINHTSPTRVRPYSQGPSTLGSIGKSSSNGLSVLNQSTGSISMQNNISVHHAMPLAQQSTSSLAPPISPPVAQESNQVIVSGPTTVTSRKSANKSVTLLNVNSVNVNHRMSVFEPSMRDTIQHFCEKHLDKIKAYMKTVAHRLPPPAKCTIEERRAKKFAKLHFACQARGAHCLYSKTFFSMRTRHAKVWIHLMFLDLQSRSDHALSSYDSSVSSLKHCWDTLKFENRTFITLVTSAFPPAREQDALINELRNSGFFDVFEIGPISNTNSCNSLDEDVRWGCFLWVHHFKFSLFLLLT